MGDKWGGGGATKQCRGMTIPCWQYAEVCGEHKFAATSTTGQRRLGLTMEGVAIKAISKHFTRWRDVDHDFQLKLLPNLVQNSEIRKRRPYQNSTLQAIQEVAVHFTSQPC